MRLLTRAVGLALGVVADAALGDPSRHHPVAWFGRFAQQVESLTWADRRDAGTLHLGLCLAPVVALGVAGETISRRHPLTHIATTALATWAVVGARSLCREGITLADRLDAGDLAGAREQLPHLCGRDPSALPEEELARAAVESMAENTADAAVASLFWGAALGIPGLLTHRASNTLDAMVGHRNTRYARFGTPAARLDDLADLLPARITGALACLLAPVVGGNRAHAWGTMRRDAHRHPSPNGGWCESAWAGALGVQLGGRNVYFSRVEERPLLGEGPRPRSAELRRAAVLVGAVTAAATATSCAALAGIALMTRARSNP
ncbi:cobalamin biosynthesis protein [Aestuariimicrobium sp. p3-SID1156]|uniref:cobalamin biosynthesis protein n=1 Tax=Aestuariimicrobium sp. p3-SID1156 TaxID=2916038 RepID=UPI00223A8462|nr:cobalamin biosynthesis protein [Aestuariimicrobium sp. p3-SID1156]MCT1458631.1 cobalamin biosynthesis protein [Aestuariimicrobium sp. p3-SID1156]